MITFDFDEIQSFFESNKGVSQKDQGEGISDTETKNSNCCDNKKNEQNQKAVTIGFGISNTFEGIGLGGVSRVIPIAGVAYSRWAIGDAIVSNRETVS